MDSRIQKDIENIRNQMQHHNEADDRRFSELGESSTEIKNDIKVIKENHLAHIQASMTNMEINLAKNSNDTDWLKKFFWIVATASLGGAVTGILNLLIK